MAKRIKREYSYLEQWDTRYGLSKRVVVRDQNGHFVDNFSLTALMKAPKAPNSRKR